MNHLLLTFANSESVMLLMMSPGKVTKTDLRGRLHPSCMLIPKNKHTAKAQHLMMRSAVDCCKNVPKNVNTKSLAVNKCSLRQKVKKLISSVSPVLASVFLLTGGACWLCYVPLVVDMVFILLNSLVTLPRPRLLLTSTLPLTSWQTACWIGMGNFQNIHI